MLVLSRKQGEKLLIGDDIVLTVNRISGNRVAIGIEAPREVSIMRGELEKFSAAADEAPEASPASSSVPPGSSGQSLPTNRVGGLGAMSVPLAAATVTIASKASS